MSLDNLGAVMKIEHSFLDSHYSVIPVIQRMSVSDFVLPQLIKIMLT